MYHTVEGVWGRSARCEERWRPAAKLPVRSVRRGHPAAAASMGSSHPTWVCASHWDGDPPPTNPLKSPAFG